jgi:hypothetical protein
MRCFTVGDPPIRNAIFIFWCAMAHTRQKVLMPRCRCGRRNQLSRAEIRSECWFPPVADPAIVCEDRCQAGRRRLLVELAPAPLIWPAATWFRTPRPASTIGATRRSTTLPRIAAMHPIAPRAARPFVCHYGNYEHQAGNATETRCDVTSPGDRLTISRRTLHSWNAANASVR